MPFHSSILLPITRVFSLFYHSGMLGLRMLTTPRESSSAMKSGLGTCSDTYNLYGPMMDSARWCAFDQKFSCSPYAHIVLFAVPSSTHADWQPPVMSLLARQTLIGGLHECALTSTPALLQVTGAILHTSARLRADHRHYAGVPTLL